jgi:FkbM family methyltransferase
MWIPRGQDRLLRSIWNPDSGKHFKYEVEFFGQRYRGDLAQYIDWAVFCYGCYSYNEISLLEELVAVLRDREDQPLSFYDVGANVGHHSLFMSSIVDHVYAFEPFSILHRSIEEKKRLNGIHNIHILPFALGDYDELAAYFPGAGSNSGAGSLIPTRVGVDHRCTTIVDVRRGDRLLDEIGLPKVDILKIDVEGFEGNVLRGLSCRIKRDRPIILTELSEDSYRNLGSEVEFCDLLYDGAVMAEVTGRMGHRYSLERFGYARSHEVLIVPDEMATFVQQRMKSACEQRVYRAG